MKILYEMMKKTILASSCGDAFGADDGKLSIGR